MFSTLADTGGAISRVTRPSSNENRHELITLSPNCRRRSRASATTAGGLRALPRPHHLRSEVAPPRGAPDELSGDDPRQKQCEPPYPCAMYPPRSNQVVQQRRHQQQ